MNANTQLNIIYNYTFSLNRHYKEHIQKSCAYYSNKLLTNLKKSSQYYSALIV